MKFWGERNGEAGMTGALLLVHTLLKDAASGRPITFLDTPSPKILLGAYWHIWYSDLTRRVR
jgi:hypothetical protein